MSKASNNDARARAQHARLTPLFSPTRLGMRMRTCLAAVHHNFNIEAEEEGYRGVERISRKYSKALGQVVPVVRKTQVAVTWKTLINNRVSEATCDRQANAIMHRDDHDPFAMSAAADDHDALNPEWSLDETSGEEDIE